MNSDIVGWLLIAIAGGGFALLLAFYRDIKNHQMGQNLRDLIDKE